LFGDNGLDGLFGDNGFDGLDRDRDTKFNGMIDFDEEDGDNGFDRGLDDCLGTTDLTGCLETMNSMGWTETETPNSMG
jgi:hypothetical protein